MCHEIMKRKVGFSGQFWKWFDIEKTIELKISDKKSKPIQCNSSKYP